MDGGSDRRKQTEQFELCMFPLAAIILFILQLSIVKCIARSKLRLAHECVVLRSDVELISYLLHHHPEIFTSPTSIKRCIRHGCLYLNDQPVCRSQEVFLKPNDVIQVFERDVRKSQIQIPTSTQRHLLPVLYEDDFCAVVVKPFNMPMFSLSNCSSDPSIEASLHTCILHSLTPAPISVPSPLRRPQSVHRLDTLTGGVVVVAKTLPALRAMTESFSRREVDKRYLAISAGRLVGKGDIVSRIGGLEAHSRYRVLQNDVSKSYGTISSVEVQLFTGRTHQIRRHLDGLGYPIVGDPRYWFRASPHLAMPSHHV